ncbi:MAG: hypothetical protein HYS04_09890 [Acidobacteria bacterium]|nr:hypothetical protein [Acidobacteriota bacterium]
MDERPDKIVEHIEAERGRLEDNLDELQSRVRRTVDWRAQFERHPYLMMSVAAGGGALLSSLLIGAIRDGRGGSYRDHSRWGEAGSASGSGVSTSAAAAGALMSQSNGGSQGKPASSLGIARPRSRGPALRQCGFEQQKQKTIEIIDQIGGALLAMLSAKAKEFVMTALPAIRPYLERAEKFDMEHPRPAGLSGLPTPEPSSSYPG